MRALGIVMMSALMFVAGWMSHGVVLEHHVTKHATRAPPARADAAVAVDVSAATQRPATVTRFVHVPCPSVATPVNKAPLEQAIDEVVALTPEAQQEAIDEVDALREADKSAEPDEPLDVELLVETIARAPEGAERQDLVERLAKVVSTLSSDEREYVMQLYNDIPGEGQSFETEGE